VQKIDGLAVFRSLLRGVKKEEGPLKRTPLQILPAGLCRLIGCTLRKAIRPVNTHFPTFGWYW